MDEQARGSGDRKVPFELERIARPALFMAGTLLMVSGVFAAFNPKLEALSATALLAAGFAVLFVSYLGDRLTSIRFREFEARLEKVVTQAELQTERVRQEADAALAELEHAAEAYSATRSRMRPGGDRDDAMSRDLEGLVQQAKETPPSMERIKALSRSRDGKERVTALAAMRSSPKLWDFDSVLYAIGNPINGFEQDRFMVLAADMLHNLSPSERDRLLAAVRKQQATGEAKPGRIRWYSAERLCRLIEDRRRDESAPAILSESAASRDPGTEPPPAGDAPK